MLINILLGAIAVVFFGLIVFIHELGHFVTAKLSGIRVNEFAIGMGPTLFHFGKKETRYSLRLFPIGGFCAMEGEDEQSDDARAFNNKPVWKKILVVVMGAVMNILLGIILMMIILGQQSSFASTTVAPKFEPNSALQSAGIKAGDTFYSVDGYRVYTDRDLLFALATTKTNIVDFKMVRGNQIISFSHVKLNTVKSDGKQVLSLDFHVMPISKNIGTLVVKSAQDTVSIVRLVWYSLGGLITGKFGFNDLAGPVGTASVISQAAAAGLKVNFMAAFNNILFVMMILTVNLGVVNLLPLPALDGGRLVFLIVEGIRRKPINPKYEGWINAAGFALLMALMLLVTFSDILRLITGKGLGA